MKLLNFKFFCDLFGEFQYHWKKSKLRFFSLPCNFATSSQKIQANKNNFDIQKTNLFNLKFEDNFSLSKQLETLLFF